MNYNTFDTTTGPQLIALDRQDDDFTYTSPKVVDAEPDRFVPYDFVIEKRGLVEENERMYQRYARIPTEPTKQELEG
jgi:hypothetical protein